MIRNFAKFSCVLNIAKVSISSLSESDSGRLCVRVARIVDFTFQQLCTPPILEPYKGTLYGNGSPISNAKATLLSCTSFTIPTYLNTKDLRLVDINSSSRIEKTTTFISCPHHASSLPLKGSQLNTSKKNNDWFHQPVEAIYEIW